jgi:hypothetical protein
MLKLLDEVSGAPLSGGHCIMRRIGLAIGSVLLGLALYNEASDAQAQDSSLGRYFYYPHYYYPHNYWPTQGPQWPERPGEPYMKPPAYMTYPPFTEPHWRFEWMQPQHYYRGFHFWLDQF